MPSVALDIETISPSTDDTTTVDFLDSRSFELAAIGVGHRAAPDATPTVEVLWRDGIDTRSEYDLLAELCDWLTDRHYDELITYNGVHFDHRHLTGRASIIAEETGAADLPVVLHRALDAARHRDLMHAVIREHGHRVALEDAVEQHAAPRPPTVQWRGRTVENGDIPELAEQLLAYEAGLADLDAEDAAQLRDALSSYVRADIEPLFRLRDAFAGRERR